jgi:hypothetical protein
VPGAILRTYVPRDTGKAEGPDGGGVPPKGNGGKQGGS